MMHAMTSPESMKAAADRDAYGSLLFSLFSRFSQKLSSTSFSQNLVSQIWTTI
jgi:hypothetical protein